jgi:hypothetical protein
MARRVPALTGTAAAMQRWRAMTRQIGRQCWAIPEGYIPGGSVDPDDRALVSHEAVCLLNASGQSANIKITLFFEDREPVGPFQVQLAARRTKHLRFNDLSEPESVPRDTPFSSLIESDVPIVVQHTRLDSRNPNIALLSTIAFPAE